MKTRSAASSRRRRWLRGATLAVVLLILVVGCASADPQNYFAPASDLATQIRDLFGFIIYIAIGVFVVVEGALVYALIRFRARPGQGRPPQTHGNTPVEVAWTIAPAVILAIIAIPTIATIFRTYGAPPPDSMPVKIVGHQWWWEAQYPNQNIITANEIHVPVGKPVTFILSSADVIHSFWVPKLAGKRDVIPNRTNEFWLTPDQTGVYEGQCAEFCGTQHANMRLRVMVDTQDAFDAWVRDQQAPPAVALAGLAAEGRTIFSQSACIGCHTIQGVSQGKIGPDLTHVASRTTIAAGTLSNTPDNLRRWLRNPQEVKPGNLMPNLGLSDAQLDALVAYLESLK